jgi:hypothetical protein
MSESEQPQEELHHPNGETLHETEGEERLGHESSAPAQEGEQQPEGDAPPTASASAPPPEESQEGQRKERKGPPDTTKMHSVKVDNLSFDTKEEDLRTLFEQYGKITDVSARGSGVSLARAHSSFPPPLCCGAF